MGPVGPKPWERVLGRARWVGAPLAWKPVTDRFVCAARRWRNASEDLQKMKRAESIGCPAKAPDRTVLSTAAKPLFLPLIVFLGGGLCFADRTPDAFQEGDTPQEGQEPVQDDGAVAPIVDQAADQVEEAPEEPLQEPPKHLTEELGLSTGSQEPDLEPEHPTAEEFELPAQGQPSWNGYVNLRTRSRWAEDSGDDDHDLYGVVGANYYTKGKDNKDGWGLHLLLRGSWGLNEQDPDSIFFSVQDTYRNRIDTRIYHAYADVPVGDRLGLARIGRMVIYNTPLTTYIDGVQVETAPVGPTQVVLGAYGGLSVHQFESWPSDEWMGGVYTHFRPWEDGQMRIDWMHLNDNDKRFGDGENDLVSAEVVHRVNENLRLEGDFSLLEGDSNDLRLKGFWVLPEEEVTVRFSYYSLLRAHEDLAYELNPYFNFLSTYFPYDESQLVISKTFSEALELYGGLNVRRVDDDSDIGRFNRDYDRYYLTATFPDLLPMNTALSLTGEVWDSPDNDIQTWGLDLTSRMEKGKKLSVGSYYSLYKYEFDVEAERVDVRTLYAEFKKPVSDSTNIMARYEYENEEIDSFHTLRLGVTWRF